MCDSGIQFHMTYCCIIINNQAGSALNSLIPMIINKMSKASTFRGCEKY